MWRDAGHMLRFSVPRRSSSASARMSARRCGSKRAAKRLLVLLDPALVNSAIHRKVAGILAQQDVATVVFNVSDADPSGSIVQAALESRRQQWRRWIAGHRRKQHDRCGEGCRRASCRRCH